VGDSICETQGLLDGQQDKVLVPDGEAMGVISKLARSDVAEIAAAARQVERRFTGQRQRSLTTWNAP